MGMFATKEDVHAVFDPFLKEVLTHPLIGPKLARAKMVVRFEYTEPNTFITINLKDPPKDGNLASNCTWDDPTLEADVTFIQTADFSNRFWQGKENVIAAMAKRQVTARGSITKALQLIPVIRPAFRIYPQVLQKLGKQNLVVNE